MQKKRINHKEFIAVWESSVSVGSVAEHFGVTNKSATSRANKYRRRGITLKRHYLYSEDWGALVKFYDSLKDTEGGGGQGGTDCEGLGQSRAPNKPDRPALLGDIDELDGAEIVAAPVKDSGGGDSATHGSERAHSGFESQTAPASTRVEFVGTGDEMTMTFTYPCGCQRTQKLSDLPRRKPHIVLDDIIEHVDDDDDG